MTQLTVSIDAQVLDQARKAAADLNQPLDAVVQTLLADFASRTGAAETPEDFARLQAFSWGRIGYRQLMRELGIDHHEALFLRMCAAGLPMPALPAEATRTMVENFDRVLRGAGR